MSPLTRALVVAIGTVLPLTFSGCRDGTSVAQRINAVYVLRTINGQPLPAYASQGSQYGFLLRGDTLVFSDSGFVTRSMTFDRVSVQLLEPDTTYHVTVRPPYSIDGRALLIGARFYCAPNALCTGWDEGTIDAAEVCTTQGMYWAGAPQFVYARVSRLD